MAHTKSALKSVRQTAKNRAFNLKVKRNVTEALKAVRKAIVGKEADLAAKIKTAQKALGKAAQKGVLKRNTAARYMSRLMAQAKKVGK